MKELLNLEGERFGKLLVISEAEAKEYFNKTKAKFIYKRTWLCLCDCGEQKIVSQELLRRGETKSCGCLRREVFLTMISSHGLCETPTYNSWRAMKERCTNTKNLHYDIYGGRGISFPEKWANFEGFYEDMGERPDGKTLDRVNNDLGYSKENCKWSTVSEQNINGGLRSDNKTGYRGITVNKNYPEFYLVSYKSKIVFRTKDLAEALEIRRKYVEKELTPDPV